MTAAFEVNGALVAGAATVTFAARYDAVVVKNDDATNGIYVRTDGVTPASPWDDCYYVEPNGALQIPNDDAVWFQGQGTSSDGTTVILVGTGTSSFNVTGV